MCMKSTLTLMERKHTHTTSHQQSQPCLLHLTQPAERKNDLTATLHSGVDVREDGGAVSFFLQQPVCNLKKYRV
eukprot:scaffold739_cov200-Skeletonema_dohrnii-CCMP3373.AAC.1